MSGSPVRFARDSPLEGDGFEPSVPSGENYAHETAPLIATAFPFGRKADSFVRGTVRIIPFGPGKFVRILWCKPSNSGSRELLSGAGLTACDVPWFSANSPPPSSGDGDEGVRALESQTAAE